MKTFCFAYIRYRSKRPRSRTVEGDIFQKKWTFIDQQDINLQCKGRIKNHVFRHWPLPSKFSVDRNLSGTGRIET